jgi:predicted nucleotidyltransferase
MSIREIIEVKRSEIRRIAEEHGASNVRLFGSAARNEADIASDADFLVEMGQGRSLLDLIGLAQDLEDLLGCKVDVVTEASLSPYLRERVLKEALAQ